MIANLKNSMKKRLKVQRNADAKECRCKVYPFRFKRIKLPVKLSFAMTIN